MSCILYTENKNEYTDFKNQIVNVFGNIGNIIFSLVTEEIIGDEKVSDEPNVRIMNNVAYQGKDFLQLFFSDEQQTFYIPKEKADYFYHEFSNIKELLGVELNKVNLLKEEDRPLTQYIP